ASSPYSVNGTALTTATRPAARTGRTGSPVIPGRPLSSPRSASRSTPCSQRPVSPASVGGSTVDLIPLLPSDVPPPGPGGDPRPAFGLHLRRIPWAGLHGRAGTGTEPRIVLPPVDADLACGVARRDDQPELHRQQ